MILYIDLDSSKSRRIKYIYQRVYSLRSWEGKFGKTIKYSQINKQ